MNNDIFKELIYADIFDWVLRPEEIKKYLGVKKLDTVAESRIRLGSTSFAESRRAVLKNGFWILPGREKNIDNRLEREKWAAQKLIIAKKIARWLKIIPSILLVGVSGGLAVGNVTGNDDIDFFIICRNGTLWTTRFLATILLDFLGKRRHPKDKNYNNKICLNMFVDETGMITPQEERDIFTAHEIKQMKVLWERKETYRRFLKNNQWIKNRHSESRLAGQRISRRSLDSSDRSDSLGMTETAERFLRWLQLKYMSKKRTNEKIEAHRLMFHPQDKREEILREYKKRLR